MNRGGTYIPATRFPRKHAPKDEVMRWEGAIRGKIKIGQGWMVDGMRARLLGPLGETD